MQSGIFRLATSDSSPYHCLMPRILSLSAVIGFMISVGYAQQRVESTRQNTAQGLPEIRGVQGLQGIQGVGSRRSLPNRYEFRNNAAGGRKFEQSFDMTTDAQFRAHNIDNVSERLVGESLYNNPWYWQNLGSLDTELMTGGSGLPIASSGIDGNYYNPFMYDQWSTTSGLRHSGAMTGEVGVPASLDQFAQKRSDIPRPASLAPIEGTGDPLALKQSQPGLLAADRTVLSGHRLQTTLQSNIDDSWSGRFERPLGRGVSQDRQPLRYIGSSLRGLSMAPDQGGLFEMGLSSYDLARLREDQIAGRPLPMVGQAWDTRFHDLTSSATAIDTRIEPGAAPLPVAADLKRTYQAMADRYASLHPATMTLDQRLAAIELDYRRMRGELITGPDWLAAHTPSDTEPLVPGGLTNESTQPPTEPAGSTPATPSGGPSETLPAGIEAAPPPLAWEDYGLVLRHGQQIESFDSGSQGRFNDLVAAAEQRLKTGDYFWAERRFNRALRFIPGHPLAMAGMGHAQIGASLYLSAALTLQSLLAFQPEMIDVQYAADLLPAQKDLDRAISILTARIQGDADLDRYGFLLAYIGHQLGRQDLVQVGLGTMRRGGADPSFTQLLSEIWSPEPAALQAPEQENEGPAGQ